MKKEDRKVVIITVLVFVLIMLVINIIQFIDKDEIVVKYLYDIEIQKIEDLDKYLIYDKGLIKFRDAARETGDNTIDYVVTSKTTITYIVNDDPIIKVYEIKYKNPIQEFVIHRNKGMKVVEILVPAGTVKWSSNDN